MRMIKWTMMAALVGMMAAGCMGLEMGGGTEIDGVYYGDEGEATGLGSGAPSEAGEDILSGVDGTANMSSAMAGHLVTKCTPYSCCTYVGTCKCCWRNSDDKFLGCTGCGEIQR